MSFFSLKMLRARVELWSLQFNYGADINPSQSVFRRLEHFLSTSKYIKLWQAKERKKAKQSWRRRTRIVARNKICENRKSVVGLIHTMQRVS